MKISIIVISRDKETARKQIQSLKQLKNQQNAIKEILLIVGNSPSKQRNEGIKKSSGEWIYFLDDDSILSQESFVELVNTIERNPEAKIIGGPSLLQEGANNWERAVQTVFSSNAGIGPIRSRYNSIGNERSATEKDLILCNMAVKKEVFDEIGYFNEDLYPNEENEFLKRVSKKFIKIYNPKIKVYRFHRKTADGFFRQMISYGNGRTRNFLFNKKMIDLIYYVPLVFFCSVIILTFVGEINISLPILLFYLSVITVSSAIKKFIMNKNSGFLQILLAYFLCHTGYSFGLLKGFFESGEKFELKKFADIINLDQVS